MDSDDRVDGLEMLPITRRDLLLALGVVGVSLAVGGITHGETLPKPLLRPIPGRGEELPVIGLGTSRVFEVGSSESERLPLKEVVAQLASLPNSVLDTSPMYGEAEEVAGDLMRALNLRERLFIATKVWTTGREQGINQMEQSMRLLGTGQLDLIQIHNLEDWRTHIGTLREWRERGRIRYLGITHYHEGAHDALERVMQTEPIDFVQLNYSMAESEARERLLPLAQERGIAVIVNRPFARGRLFRAVKGVPLPGWAAEFGCRSWAQFFLKYVIAHPAVTCAIPATSKVRHMIDNQGAGYPPLPDISMQRRMLDWMKSV